MTRKLFQGGQLPVACRRSDRDCLDTGRLPGIPGEAMIESGEFVSLAAAGQMQCVCEIQGGRRPVESFANGERIFQTNISQPGEFSQGHVYAFLIEAVKAAQHSLGFEQHGLPNPHFFCLHQRSSASGLPGVVTGDQANQNISIDSDHDPPLQPLRLPGPVALVFSTFRCTSGNRTLLQTWQA